MSAVPLELPAEERLRLSEHFSMAPPAGWPAKVNFENLPLRLVAYGRLVFQPPGADDVFLKWQITNWLEGQSEWEIFQDLLLDRSKPSEEELWRLYSLLLRIPVDFFAEYSVADTEALGPALVIDYRLQKSTFKGRVLYVPSPTGTFDVQMVSYEGPEPNFSHHLIEALAAMGSCRLERPYNYLWNFIIPKPQAGDKHQRAG